MNDLNEDMEREQTLRKRWRGIVENRNADEDEVRKALDEVNHELGNKRAKRKALREEDRDEKAEDIADQIEELEDRKDDLLLALDDKQKRTETAEKILKEHQARVKQIRRKREARAQARKGRGNLTPHFSVEEFGCRDGTPVPQAALPALKAWCQIIGEPLRARFGPVRINSGYRTRSYNASIGGATNSVHIYDFHPNAVAGDLTCQSGSPLDWFNFTAGKADGRGRYATFHHADNRNRIGWPDAVWSG